MTQSNHHVSFPTEISSFEGLPESWTSKKIKSVATIIVSNKDKKTLENGIPVRLCNYNDVYKHDRLISTGRYMKATATTEEINKFVLRSNDVVITKDSEDWKDIGVPAFIVDEASDWLCGYHLAILRSLPSSTSGSYLFWSMKAAQVNIQMMVAANGVTRFGLSHLGIKNTVIPVPPIVVQNQIARYLDFKSYQINKYIRIKKRQIELLKELRQVIINDAVIGKIDVRTGKPYHQYKDSGIDWLGMIPNKWQHRTMAKVCNLIVDGTHFSPKSYVTGEFKYITAKNIKEHGIDLSDVSYISASDHDPIYARCPVTKGDVLYIKDGATAGIATVNNLDEPFSLLSSVAMIRTHHYLNPSYLVYYLNSSTFKSHLLSTLTGGAMTRFTIDKLKRYFVLYPSYNLQGDIVKYLDAHVNTIDSIIKVFIKSVDFLRDLQTRLISDAITGKLDLRDINVPDLPKDEFEPEIELFEVLAEECLDAD